MSNFFRLTCVEIIFLIRFLTDPRYIAHLWRKNGMCIEAEKKFIPVYTDIWIDDQVFILLHSRGRLVEWIRCRYERIEISRWFKDCYVSYERYVSLLRVRMNFTKRRYVIKMYTLFTDIPFRQAVRKLKTTECNHDESTMISHIQTTRKGHGRQVTLESQINCNCGGSVTINRR